MAAVVAGEFCANGFLEGDPPVDSSELPASLVERFEKRSDSEKVLAVLGLLMPLTSGANCAVDL